VKYPPNMHLSYASLCVAELSIIVSVSKLVRNP